jgi:bacterioferritin (cytochrome b1)
MPEQEEKLDEKLAIERLNRALTLQYRSALQYSVVSASLLGIEALGLGEKLTAFGDEELSGARTLIEKIVSFGGTPTVEVAELSFQPVAKDAVGRLAEYEDEVLEALQDAIEPTGREARSEALEHCLEHLIFRKQHQVDFLRRAVGD